VSEAAGLTSDSGSSVMGAVSNLVDAGALSGTRRRYSSDSTRMA
jgi:hypothetical protein